MGKTILVFGAKGKQGKVATLELQAAGFKVRGTSRDLEGETALKLADAGINLILINPVIVQI